MKRILIIGVAILLAASLGVGMVGADEHTRSTDLQIDQPHYIEDGVTQLNENGSTVYEAEGKVLDIYPSAFATENVVNFGVEPDGARLESTPGGYELTPEEHGTYTLYWIVEEETTSGNQTSVERVRYEATVRVASDYEDPVVMRQGEVEDLRDDADKWEHLNSTVQSHIDDSILLSAGSWLPFIDSNPTAMDYIGSALNKNQLVHNPGAVFGSGLTMLVLGILSLGGLAVTATAFGWHGKVVAYLRGRLNVFEVTEQAEGEAAKRMEADEIKYNKISFQNESFDDVYLPHIADGMRSLGETPFEADRNLSANGLMPSVWAAFEAQAMGQDGYVGVLPDDDLAADGGETDDDTEAKIEMLRDSGDRLDIVPEDDVPEGAVTVDLTKAGRDWLAVLPVNGETMFEYDPTEADIDRSAIEVDNVSWDLESIIEQVRLDMRHFDSERQAGRYLREFVEDVIDHPITDPDGRVRTARMVLETLLRDAQLLNDRHDIPKEYQVEILQAAIADDDPLEDGLNTVRDIERGKYA